MASIILSVVGSNKVTVIKTIREITGLGLKETKEAVDFVSDGGKLRIEGIAPENLDNIIKQFVILGAYVNEEDCADTVKTEGIVTLKSVLPIDSEFQMDIKEKERLLQEERKRAEPIEFRPLASSEAISKLDRENTMKVLLEAQKIAEDFEEYNDKIVALQERIRKERQKAEDIKKTISSKTKWIIRIATICGVVIGMLIGSIFGAVICGIVVRIIMNLTVKKSDLKKHETENMARSDEYFQTHVEPLLLEIEEVFGFKDNLMNGGRYEWAVDIVGKDMFYSKCINDLYNIVKTRRADSVKEALNKYDDTQYKARMEEMQQAIQNAAEVSAIEAVKQSAQMKQIEKNTHQAARASKISAAYNFGTYVNTRKK